mmetsp:Transcript_13691/g.33138  ORF Transcript_13691/g.33138 Transcript_13691/m.33138 type:complete len:99 (+) Transcript_13691:2392-2688(+)
MADFDVDGEDGGALLMTDAIAPNQIINSVANAVRRMHHPKCSLARRSPKLLITLILLMLVTWPFFVFTDREVEEDEELWPRFRILTGDGRLRRFNLLL